MSDQPPVSHRAPIRRRRVLGVLASSAVVLGLLGAGIGLWHRSRHPAPLSIGASTWLRAPRVGTGHQRVESLAFSPDATLLAAACPRYNRLVIERVLSGPDGPRLTCAADVPLPGRPVAVRAWKERFLVLVRPVGDARHIEPGSLLALDHQGRETLGRLLVGFDPDDLAVSPDGTRALVLLSGHAEGETGRHDPCLLELDLTDSDAPRIAGRLVFDRDGDDPHRLAVCWRSGGRDAPPTARVAALVTLRGSAQVAFIDLSEPARPRLVRRQALPDARVPESAAFLSPATALVTADDGSLWCLSGPELAPSAIACDPGVNCLWTSSSQDAAHPDAMPSPVLATAPTDSRIVLLDPASAPAVQSSIPLRGPWGLAPVIPTALDVQHGRIAVADRSGGVHLIERKSPASQPASPNP